MKLLVISTNGVLNDGITSWFIQHFSHMDRAGLQVDTVAFEGVPDKLVTRLHEIDVRTFVLPSRRQHPMRYLRALRRLIRKESYEVIHVNGNSGTVALELLASVCTTAKTRIVHSHNTQGKYPTYDQLLRPVMKLLCTDRFACGQQAGKWLFGDSPFTVIPNGKVFSDYSFRPESRARIRSQLGLTDEHVAIGHVGTFNTQKNHAFLVQAFAEALRLNPRLRLVLIGDGVLKEATERRVSELDIQDQVQFVGQTDSVPSYLSAFDVAVLPSRYEGFPNVVIECQVSGLPILVSSTVTDECAISELVTFLESHDSQAWANAMAGAPRADRVDASRDAQLELKRAGYDVHDGAARLRDCYERTVRPRR